MSVVHGDRRTYRAGCRCDVCSLAMLRLRKSYDLDRARGNPRPFDQIDAVPARTHVLWLRDDQGMSERSVSRASGVSLSTLQGLLRGPTRPKIQRNTAEKLLAVKPASLLLPKQATMLRMHALNRLGYTFETVLEMSGLKFLNPYRNHTLITRAVAQAVLDVCVRVGDTPGPSPLAAKRATGRGCRPPADFDPGQFYDVQWNGEEGELELTVQEDRAQALLDDCDEIERTLREPNNDHERLMNRDLVAARLGVSYDYIVRLRTRRASREWKARKSSAA